MKHYRRFMLLLAMLMAATFGLAQDWTDVPENRFAVTVKIDSAIASEPQKLYMYLIDRDGTILSTSTDAEELEPKVKAAIERE